MFQSKKPKRFHSFHIVTPSPWPFFTSIFSFMVVLSFVLYMHRISIDSSFLSIFFKKTEFGFFLFSFSFLVFCLSLWWRDVIREATFEGKHTKKVQRSHKIGFVLFIASEVMFFFGFFWAFFHSSLSPSVEIGCVWPPEGIIPFNPWKVPLFNTFTLLLSGLTITITHNYLVSRNFSECVRFFVFTILLAILFTLVQLYEYRTSSFSISDGIYGSTFFMSTGFHGLHVIIGTIFISVCLFRLMRGHFTNKHHVGFECAAWYWHFVDIVWLFLFVSIYWWGGWR